MFALVLVLLLGTVITGCGGGGRGNSGPGQVARVRGGPGHVVRLRADPTGALSFDQDGASSAAGELSLMLSNPSPVAHAIAIEGPGVSAFGAVVGRGGTSAVRVVLKPGAYTFYCPVPGHRQAGMRGTLTVR